jgi:fructooligosaccharide transport system substrate-binding protein
VKIHRLAYMGILGLLAVSTGVSAKNTVVTIWTGQDFDVRWGKQHHQILWGPFEQKNPGIEIRWSRPADYDSKILAAYASGSAPDIFAVDGINVPAWANRGMLEPLDKYIPNDVKNDYWKTCLDEMTWKGKMYALGLETNSHVAFYNPAMLAKAGLARPARTWEELDAQSKKLSLDTNGDGIFEQYCAESWIGGEGEGATWMDMAIIWQNGGEVFDEDTNKPLFNQKKAVDALQWFQNACYKSNIFTSRKNLKLQAGGFDGQRVAYSWSGPFNYGPYEKLKFKWEVAPTPWPESGKRVSGVGGWHFAMSKVSKNKEATAKVMQYISSKEFVRTLAESYGMPVRSSVVKEWDARNRYPWSVAIEQMTYGKARPRHPQYKYISEQVWKAFNDIVWKQSPVQARLDEGVRQLEVLLRAKK